ncbi:MULTISPECIES: AraC family transcriptional regulator [Marinobacter]|uniref:AraC family transcriptional regulator n=1 Tax=Marinobacter xiaoshiensis TaxID=3073652 RepID=A0ABU2HKL4_9GAMM|nr:MULTISPECIES: AraC family transcriptional regulator [unclassified Marinobacter]MBK1886724.1 AraC family transcriptional regulator [Marinobacter sp. DY40_1A1]MDS1311613.1 AraC family transcriptional regulator [Marinobacter sp. F60267]
MNPTTPQHFPDRNPLGDISVLHISVLLRAAEAEGVNSQELARHFQLNAQTLTSPEARISIPRFMRLGHAAIQACGNPALGLRMGALTRPVDMGLPGLTAECTNTAGKAIHTLIRYSLLTSRNSRGTPTADPEKRLIQFYSIQPYNAFNYFVVDSVLSAWTQFLRTVSGQWDVLEKVCIEYPSTGLDELYESWFRCPVQFGADSNGITVRQDIWSQTTLQAHPAMHEKLLLMCEAELRDIQRGWTTGDRVKSLLTPLFRGETPSLETIASKLGVTPWTLQRQLASENTGFRELMDETRKHLARDYIRETETSLSEIAWLLGFSNPAALHKAYRRWFEISPGEHRKQFRGD